MEGRAIVESNWLKQDVNDPHLQPAANAAQRALLGLSEKQVVAIWNELDAILKPHRIPRHFGLHRGPIPRDDCLLVMDLSNVDHPDNPKLLGLLNKHEGKVLAVLLLHLLHHDGEERAALKVYGLIRGMVEIVKARSDTAADRLKQNKKHSDAGKKKEYKKKDTSQWTNDLLTKLNNQKGSVSQAARDVKKDLEKSNPNKRPPSVRYLRNLLSPSQKKPSQKK